MLYIYIYIEHCYHTSLFIRKLFFFVVAYFIRFLKSHVAIRRQHTIMLNQNVVIQKLPMLQVPM
jgi:hypothetical protein